jgi:hypothetical protein
MLRSANPADGGSPRTGSVSVALLLPGAGSVSPCGGATAAVTLIVPVAVALTAPVKR